MGILIDSTVLIPAEKGQLSLEPWIESHPQEPLVLSALTASELLHGVHRAVDAKRRLKREQFVEGILLRFPVVEFGIEAARVHARMWAELESQGKMIGAHDLMIAATAVSLDFHLATANLREFKKVPGLKVLYWGVK